MYTIIYLTFQWESHLAELCSIALCLVKNSGHFPNNRIIQEVTLIRCKQWLLWLCSVTGVFTWHLRVIKIYYCICGMLINILFMSWPRIVYENLFLLLFCTRSTALTYTCKTVILAVAPVPGCLETTGHQHLLPFQTAQPFPSWLNSRRLRLPLYYWALRQVWTHPGHQPQVF